MHNIRSEIFLSCCSFIQEILQQVFTYANKAVYCKYSPSIPEKKKVKIHHLVRVHKWNQCTLTLSTCRVFCQIESYFYKGGIWAIIKNSTRLHHGTVLANFVIYWCVRYESAVVNIRTRHYLHKDEFSSEIPYRNIMLYFIYIDVVGIFRLTY